MAESTNPNYLKFKRLMLETNELVYGRLMIDGTYVVEVLTDEDTHKYFEIRLVSKNWTELTKVIPSGIDRSILVTDKTMYNLITENALIIYSQDEYEGTGSGSGSTGPIPGGNDDDDVTDEDGNPIITNYIVGKDRTSKYRSINKAIQAARAAGYNELNPCYIIVKPGVYEENVDLYPGVHVHAQASDGTMLLGQVVYHAPNNYENVASWDGVSINSGNKTAFKYCAQTNFNRELYVRNCKISNASDTEPTVEAIITPEQTN